MPAFTTIFAGLSALGGLNSVNQASKTRDEQRRQLAAQNTAAKEAASQGAQVGGPDAEFVLGTQDTAGAASKLLKTAIGGAGKATTSVGGLTSNATKIGGL